MYYYIVDPNTGDGSFSDIQHKLKSRLHRLNIDGEFAKVLEEKDIPKITKAAIKRKMKTIVVVGDDRTINEVINTVNESGAKSISIGIIPLGGDNTLANYLGIYNWQEACELLAARRLQTFNSILINDCSFIHSCSISPKDNAEKAQILAEIDGSYKLRGDVYSTKVTNQKLHNVNLFNQLLLQFDSAVETPSFWSRLTRRKQSPYVPTQLHARVAILEFSTMHTAVIDGRTLEDTLFRIRLSEIPVQIITAKFSHDKLDAD